MNENDKPLLPLPERKKWFARITELWVEHASPTRQVAVILAFGLAVSITIIALMIGISELFTSKPIPVEMWTAFASILTAIVAALSVYLGRREPEKPKNEDEKK